MSQVPPSVPPPVPPRQQPYPAQGYPQGDTGPGHSPRGEQADLRSSGYAGEPVPGQALNYAPPPSGVDLRTIAVRQKGIMFCILAYITLLIGQFLFPPELRPIVGLLALGATLTASVFVFMLALTLYNTGVGILLGILTLIPIVGLIVLLVINGKATNILRHHGIKVGLMGADAKQIPAPGTVQVPLR